MAKPDTKKSSTKNKKKRAKKYNEKLKINGTFDELLKALSNPKEPIKTK